MARLSANLTFLFTEVPFPERFARAARCGFRAVEFTSPYECEARALGDLVRAQRLEVSAFNLPPGDWAKGERGLCCLPDRVGEFQDGVEKAIAYAKELGCPQVHAMAGIRPRGAPEEELRRTYAANLRFAARACGRAGLGVLVEALNARDVPGYFVATPDEALSWVERSGEPNVRVLFDAYHAHLAGVRVVEALERAFARVGHVQIADAPGRGEPGTGEIDFPALFGLLDRLGYAGWIGCEYRPRGDTEAGLGWRERVVQTRP